jgi:hypothetical protein
MADLLRNFPNLPPAVQAKILNASAFEVPEGIIPNFDNPPKDNTTGLALGVTCLTLTSIVVLGRIYSRAFVIKRPQLEDYIGILGFASFLGFTWVYFTFLNGTGFYRHQWDVRLGDFLDIAKVLTFALTITYAASLLFLKNAILLEWIRIFSPHRTNTFFSYAAWMLITFNTMLYVSSIIASAITCIPHSAAWEPWQDGKCINRRAVGIATAAFNVFADLLILLLPQKIIWNLQMGMSRKIGISLVFSMGVLATVCACGRVAVTFEIDYFGDATYTITPTLLWAYAELTCVILVFCMPALPKLASDNTIFIKIVHSLRSWTRHTTGASQKISNNEADNGRWLESSKTSKKSQEYPILETEVQDDNTTELQTLRQKNQYTPAAQTDNSQQALGPKAPLPETPRRPNRAILRTSEVQQGVDLEGGLSPDYNVTRQHPWMGQ